MRTVTGVSALALVAVFAAACSGSAASPSAAASAAAERPPHPNPPPRPRPRRRRPPAARRTPWPPRPPGTLTIGADNPAYPPYFQPSDPATDPWELGDPTNRLGFESRVGWAIARNLGYRRRHRRLGPGAVQQRDRARAQGLRHLPDPGQLQRRARAGGRPVRRLLRRQPRPSSAPRTRTSSKVTTIAGLKDFQFGAQVGTTSLDDDHLDDRPVQGGEGLRHERPRDRGAQERPDRRPRRRPADRASTSRPSQFEDGVDRRPVPGRPRAASTSASSSTRTARSPTA